MQLIWKIIAFFFQTKNLWKQFHQETWQKAQHLGLAYCLFKDAEKASVVLSLCSSHVLPMTIWVTQLSFCSYTSSYNGLEPIPIILNFV
jgi:hypothetical protein